MNMLEILHTMGTLSIDNDNFNENEQNVINLKYVNLFHFPLFSATANLNEDLPFNEVKTKTSGNLSIQLNYMPFLVQSVYDKTNRRVLSKKSFSEILQRDPDLSSRGAAYWYYTKGKDIFLYPHQLDNVIDLGVWYTKNPEPFLLTTTEEEIPYPVPFHPLLVDGGLYYLFQDVGGFRNTQKENEAKIRCETGKSNLLSYLYNRNGRFFTTYSNV